MFRYRLRTLLILLAVLPPLLGVAWVKYAQWRAEQERQRARQAIIDGLTFQLLISEPIEVTSETFLLDLSEAAALKPADPARSTASRPPDQAASSISGKENQ